MGTGRAKEIPSSERKRTCPRVKREALVKPSCTRVGGQTGEERKKIGMRKRGRWIFEV